MPLKAPTDITELRTFLQGLFGNPNLLPSSLLSFLNDYNALNQAPVPASNIIGIAGFVERLDQATDDIVVTSTTPTSVYSYQVPGDLLQVGGAIRVDLAGKYVNNSGSSKTLGVAVTYGATTMWADTSGGFNSTASTRPVLITAFLSNSGATNAQELLGMVVLGEGVTPTTGYGSFSNPGAVYPFGGTATEDSRLKKELSIIVTNSGTPTSFTRSFAYTTRIAH